MARFFPKGGKRGVSYLLTLPSMGIRKWIVCLFLCFLAAAPEKKKFNPHAFDAKITFVDPTNYTCNITSGSYGAQVIIGPGTKLTSGNKPIDFSDLKTGHKIKIATSASSSRLLIDTLDVTEPTIVRKEPVPKPVRYTVKGKVTGFNPFTQRLMLTAEGNTYFLDMSTGTPFKGKAKKEGVSSLIPNTKVSVTLQNFGTVRREITSISVDE